MMNQNKLIDEKIEHFYKLFNEEKIRTTILQKENLELNQRVIEEQNTTVLLQSKNPELNLSIQECCVEIFDQDGTEDIFEAIDKGSLNGVKFWHSKDPSSIHAKDGNYYNGTPLHYASIYGHLPIVEFLLSKGVDVDAKNFYFNGTPLMYASMNGHVPIVKALLDKGAKINYQNKNKSTPLHWAVVSNELPEVKLLIERGADRSLRDEENRTPLDKAREYGYKSIEDYLSSL